MVGNTQHCGVTGGWKCSNIILGEPKKYLALGGFQRGNTWHWEGCSCSVQILRMGAANKYFALGGL